MRVIKCLNWMKNKKAKVKVKVKYLNWDIDYMSETCMANRKHILLNSVCSGCYTGDENDYIDVNEYTIDEPVDDVVSILEGIYEEHSRINDGHFCRLKDDQRSMCVGDLIYIDEAVYCVNMSGFGEIDINNSII